MHKEHTSTPEHVSFAVQCREDWDRLLRPFLSPKKAMIKTEGYVMRRNACAEKQRFFLWAGVSVFEYLSAVCGHEVLLMNMALDPDWIKDMANTYCETQLALFEMLFEEVGKPDGFWFNEDLGFKGRPFMSQAMYRELIMPFHRRTYDYCHSHNLPIVMHSCGFVEPLISDLIEAGIDCLQTMEVKAGMDTLRIFKNYGDRIALCGGMDTRNIAASDCAAMEKELNDKLAVLRNGRYILQSDHSIPPDCEYQSYKHFVEMGTKLGERNQ
jgi:uroporphyrinogen decarboxylase